MGSKIHLLVDHQGVPLAVLLSGANVHDSKLLEPLVDAVQPIRRPVGQPGRPRKRPAKLHADKGYAYPWIVAFRRLAPRYDRQAAAALGSLHLACALISLRFLARAEANDHSKV